MDHCNHKHLNVCIRSKQCWLRYVKQGHISTVQSSTGNVSVGCYSSRGTLSSRPNIARLLYNLAFSPIYSLVQL